MGLRRNDTGNAVGKMQDGLLAWNPDSLPISGADGDYGAETEAAVGKYQKAADLDTTADFGTLGVADATTLTFILSNLTGSGEKGDQGEQGIQGEQGDAGPPGKGLTAGDVIESVVQ
jgi:peptidoglycan hydrolase-like protein with peptidoglycan-binding domain